MEENKPVYFLDLIVENVRCFGSPAQTLDLSDGKGKPAKWTIILGDNGTGKTTILKCLVALEPMQYALNQDTYTYAPKGFFHEQIADFKANISKANFNISTSFFYRGSLKKNDTNMIVEGYGFQQNISKLSETDNSSGLDKYLVIYAYGANRLLGKSSLLESKGDNSTTLFDTHATLINAEEWLLQADYAIKSSQGEDKKFLKKWFEKIKDTLIKLLPEVEEIRTREITKSQTKAGIEVKKNGIWLEIDDLGLGYQTVMAWVIDLASRMVERYPNSKNPLQEPAIVLVDEIDLHLHPHWQRTLIQNLSEIFTETQFIVTAHSPLIVQSAQDANIVLLKREGEQVKIYNKKDLSIINGWRIDQILTSDLFGLESARPPQYDEMLTKRKEILNRGILNEEDKNDLEKIGKELDKLPVSEDLKANQDGEKAMEIIRKAAEILKKKIPQ